MKTIPELLDEIEARAKAAYVRAPENCDCRACVALADIPVLVEALRKVLKIAYDFASPYCFNKIRLEVESILNRGKKEP